MSIIRHLFVFCISLFLLLAGQAMAATAYFAGGCFWCLEADFDKLPGVISTTSGYAGGEKQDAKYGLVSSGSTDHVEAVKVVYDEKRLPYIRLLDFYWQHIDPTDGEGQFCDKGKQYRAIIYYQNPEEEEIAREGKHALRVSGQFDVVNTRIEPFKSFYAAEDYHQKYYQKNPVRYRFYRYTCGRDQRLDEIWSEKS